MNKRFALIAVPLLCLFLGAGVSHAALGDNWAVGPDDDIRMKASASTGKTSDIDITVPATNVVNVKTGNLKVGDGTPGVTLNGEDAYIEGTLEVVGNLTATVERAIQFSLGDFILDTPADLTSSSTPGYAATNETAFIEWADGETGPVQVKFRVPTDYSSGGAFRVLIGKSGTDDPPSIDHQVFIDQNDTAEDTSATDQTAIEMDSANGAGSDEELTLSVTTDFASLAAGDWVTWEVWRDNTDTSTDNLELKAAEFYYTARQ